MASRKRQVSSMSRTARSCSNSWAWCRMVSLTPQISMMAMIAPAGVRSGIARYAPISPSRSLTLISRVCIGFPPSSQLEQRPGVAGKDALALGGGNIQHLHRPDGVGDEAPTLLSIERRVGRERARGGPEERVAAARGIRLAVERGVGVEHLEILERTLLQAVLARDRVQVRRAEKDLAKAEIDPPGEIRDHAAHVMRDDLQRPQLVEDPGKDQPRQARGRLVGPAEREPDFVLGGLLAGVVGKLRTADRMHPHGQVVMDHALEDRAELRGAERRAGHIGEDLDAAGAERADGAV